MTLWAISDLHLGHANILNFTHPKDFTKRIRPFETVHEMHNVIIERWNSKIKKDDTVYILGDLSFSRQAYDEIFYKLEGKPHLVLGNHDKFSRFHVDDFLSISSLIFKDIRLHNGKKVPVCFSHAPIHASSIYPRAVINFHGHTHTEFVVTDNKEKDLRYINVSCEAVDFYPVDVIEAVSNQLQHKDFPYDPYERY